jgi:hypothetical protein
MPSQSLGRDQLAVHISVHISRPKRAYGCLLRRVPETKSAGQDNSSRCQRHLEQHLKSLGSTSSPWVQIPLPPLVRGSFLSVASTCSAAGAGIKRRIDLPAQQHEQRSFLQVRLIPTRATAMARQSCPKRTDRPSDPSPHGDGVIGCLSTPDRLTRRPPQASPPSHANAVRFDEHHTVGIRGRVPILYARQSAQNVRFRVAARPTGRIPGVECSADT